MTGQVFSSRRNGRPSKPDDRLRLPLSGPAIAMSAHGNSPACPAIPLPPTRGRRAGIATTLATTVLAFALSDPASAAPLQTSRSFHGAASLVQPIAIFGTDDRRLISNLYPDLRERMGVLVHTGTQSVCTAFCVAPDVVATAGHCIAGTVSQPAGDPAELRFRRDTATGPGISIQGTSDGTLHRQIVLGAEHLNTRPPINATSDWAFLRLAKTACPAGGLRLSSRTASEVAAEAAAGHLYHVAYHRDLAHWKLAISTHCSLVSGRKGAEPEQLSRDFERAADLLLHTCDTEAASSGSPLLVDGEHGPEVVGINVGTYVRSRVITHDGQVVQRLDSEVISNTALLAAPLIAPLATFASGELLTRPVEIERLQAYLLAHGRHAGPRDGRYGPMTRKAIRAFQARVGLPVTGLATRSLLKRLETTRSAHAEH